MHYLRSLNIEHVSPALLMGPEISRRPPSCVRTDDDSTLAVMRRWFWARKPDAGFVLTDFPATLLQAQVLDEWLDARAETLHVAILADMATANVGVVEHYRTLGLIYKTAECHAA
jgi:adenylate kinase